LTHNSRFHILRYKKSNVLSLSFILYPLSFIIYPFILRGPDGAEHSMIMYRWLPGDPDAANSHDRYNRAIVFNGPWPVTLRLVRFHEDEKRVDSENGYPKDFWLGKID
jgi:hypothetical protein